MMFCRKECDCYRRYPDILGETIGRCLGTKEIETCDCGGDESKCDFYPEKRKKNNDHENGVHVSPNILKFINQIDEYEKEQAKKPWDERNIMPPGTDPQLVVECLCDVFLGEGWYVCCPLSTSQANTVILDNILHAYYPAYDKYPKVSGKE